MRPDHDADKGDLSTLLPPIPPARVLPRHDEHRAGLLAALSPEQPAARPTRPEWSSARRILVPVAAAAAVTGIIFAALALPHIGGTPATTAGKHPKPGQATPPSGPLTATRRWQVAAAGVHRVVVQTSAGSVGVGGYSTANQTGGRSGQAADAVAITAQPSYQGTPPVLTSTVRAGVLTISARCLPASGQSCQVALNLTLPRTLGIAASTGLGRVSVANINGPVTASDALGTVQLINVTGVISVHDSLGDINGVGLASPRARFAADLGAINVAFASPPARVDATDQEGNVMITVPATATYRVSEQAVLGSARCSVPRSANSPDMINASSQLGSVTVTS
jgi:hypothetical protein